MDKPISETAREYTINEALKLPTGQASSLQPNARKMRESSARASGTTTIQERMLGLCID